MSYSYNYALVYFPCDSTLLIYGIFELEWSTECDEKIRKDRLDDPVVLSVFYQGKQYKAVVIQVAETEDQLKPAKQHAESMQRAGKCKTAQKLLKKIERVKKPGRSGYPPPEMISADEFTDNDYQASSNAASQQNQQRMSSETDSQHQLAVINQQSKVTINFPTEPMRSEHHSVFQDFGSLQELSKDEAEDLLNEMTLATKPKNSLPRSGVQSIVSMSVPSVAMLENTAVSAASSAMSSATPTPQQQSSPFQLQQREMATSSAAAVGGSNTPNPIALMRKATTKLQDSGAQPELIQALNILARMQATTHAKLDQLAVAYGELRTLLLANLRTRTAGQTMESVAVAPISTASSMEDAMSFIEHLKNNDFRHNVIKELRMLGGKDSRQIVGRMIHRLMSDSLQCEFNRTGKNDKQSFKEIESLIKEAIIPGGQFDANEIEQRIANYLSDAPVRAGIRKLQRKRSSAAACLDTTPKN